MRPLRVLFADDEQMARRRMRRLLESIEGVEIVAECHGGEAALAELERIDVDVALLDVHMGAVSGLDVSEVAGELGVEVVFTTAHPAHAVTAFDRGAVDYVLKPIEGDRLVTAIARARARVEALAPSEGVAVAKGTLDRLALEVRGEIRLVRPDDVSHAVLDGELVTVWVGREAIVTELTLNDLVRRLPSPPFERVHRRAIVNLERVERLQPLPTGGYLARTREGHDVPVSRQAARALRRRLGIG